LRLILHSKYAVEPLTGLLMGIVVGFYELVKTAWRR